jgi:hypothetical protein
VEWRGGGAEPLILGVGNITESGANAVGLTLEQVPEYLERLTPHTCETLILPAAAIQDAIALALGFW